MEFDKRPATANSYPHGHGGTSERLVPRNGGGQTIGFNLLYYNKNDKLLYIGKLNLNEYSK